MVRLELERIRRARTSIDPVFLDTPQYDCAPLGDVLGCSITVEEGRDAQSGAELQGARHRDRGQPARAARGDIDRGLRRQRRQPGSGAGLQRCAAHPGQHRGRPDGEPFKVERIRALEATVRLEGDDIEDARLLARRIAADEGLTSSRTAWTWPPARSWNRRARVGRARRTTGHPGDRPRRRRAGQRRGARREVIAPHVEVIAVQPARAPAMALSWRSGAVMETETIDTIADGVAVGVGRCR